MQTNPVTRTRNQSIECVRLFCALLVVFLHSPIPGPFGTAMSAVTRFAVPFFFTVSGYFSYHAGPEQLKKRMLSILLLNLGAVLLYAAYSFLSTDPGQDLTLLGWFTNLFPTRRLFSWLLLNSNPIAGHLWYLNAMLFCYAAFFLYRQWQGEEPRYQPLYLLSCFLLTVLILLDSLLPAAGTTLDNTVYRNALFFGTPMFTLGLFLREYEQRLRSRFHLTVPRLLLIAITGLFLSLFQRYGVEKCELPVGMLLTMPAVFLLCLRKPRLTSRPWLSFAISRFGSLSTFVYVTHLLLLDLYLMYGVPVCYALLGERLGSQLYPLLIFLLALLLGILWSLLCRLVLWIRNVIS